MTDRAVKLVLVFTVLLGMLILMVSRAEAADWYVRPKTGEYGAENGQSYGAAWDGLTSVVWGEGGVVAGDTLYVCGTFTQTSEGRTYLVQPTVGGEEENPIIIRGDYPGDTGILVGARVALAASWDANDPPDGSFTTTVESFAHSYAAFEGVPGATEYVLEPVDSQAACVATDGSFYHEGSTGVLWYNPHGDTPRDVYYRWTSPIWNGGYPYMTYLNLTAYCGGDGTSTVQLDRPEDPVAARNITIQGCTFRYAQGYAVGNGYNEAGPWTIINNTFNEFSVGIYVYYGSYSITISGNAFDGGEASQKGWWAPSLQSGDRGAIEGQPGNDWLIEKNLIQHVGSHGINLYKGAGSDAHNIVVRYNRIEDINDVADAYQGRGISIDGSSSVTWGDQWSGLVVSYNIIDGVYGSEGIGLRLKTGTATVESDRMRIVGNIIADCNLSIYFRELTGGGLGVRIHNNISYVPRSGGYHVYMDNGFSDPENLLMSNNYWYPDDVTTTFSWLQVDKADFSTWVTSATAAGAVVGQGSGVLDPLFVDTGNGDYTLLSDSPCIDAGVNLDVDYSSGLRSTATWPDGISTRSQDSYGSGWEIGPFLYDNVAVNKLILILN